MDAARIDEPPTLPQSAPPRAGFGWRRVAAGLLLMAVVATGTVLLARDRAAGAPSTPPRASAGRGYYLYVSEIEVEGTNAKGDAWDAGGGAPDLAYEVRWRGATVFRSSTVADALLARWSLAAIGIDNLGGRVSKESTVRAARIRAEEGETVEIAVVDADVAFDDPVATWTTRIASLAVGETELRAPAGRVRRAVVVLRPFDEVTAGDLLK